jgi:hypothetical protein
MVMTAGLANLRVTDGDGRLTWNLPGVLWGSLTLRHGGRLSGGDRLVEADWQDGDMPARLADPGAWLPLGAWLDRRVAGYVPSNFAICGGWRGSSDRTDNLARRLEDLLRDAPIPSWDGVTPDTNCRSVPTTVAREIVSALEIDPRIKRADDGLGFIVGGSDRIDVLPILPDGVIGCACGG